MINLENPGEGYLYEEMHLLCALNRGKTPGVNVFTLEIAAALTSVLANVTLFDAACEKKIFILQACAIDMCIGKRACSVQCAFP